MKRSTRVSQLPSHLSDYEMFHDSTITSEGELVHFALIAQSKPVDFEKAMTNEKQMKAMQEEINLIERNQTWELVDLPQEKRPIALKWVYKVKVNPEGEVVKYKAKLVAKRLTKGND